MCVCVGRGEGGGWILNPFYSCGENHIFCKTVTIDPRNTHSVLLKKKSTMFLSSYRNTWRELGNEPRNQATNISQNAL